MRPKLRVGVLYRSKPVPSPSIAVIEELSTTRVFLIGRDLKELEF